MTETPFPLGRHPEAAQNHDPRSLLFPAQVDAPVRTKSWRRYGLVLDQGDLGSCTGNAGIGCLNHLPYHVVGTACGREPDAVNLYSAATGADPYPGTYPPEDTGSDGLTIGKVLTSRGRIDGYTHAFGLDHVLSAAMSGPLIVGTDWYDSMFNPDSSGLVTPTGNIVGGHEYVLDAVHVYDQVLRFTNSWSKNWGIGGHFYMKWASFGSLLTAGGDAVLFTPLTTARGVVRSTLLP